MNIRKAAFIAGLPIMFGVGISCAGVGNNLPGNPEYNLEIISQNRCPSDPMTGSNRHVITLLANFSDPNVVGSTKLTLNKTNKIMLSEGPYQVLDGNACDGDGAKFQMPANPFTCSSDDPACPNPTFMNYNVYVRSVGKLGTGIKATTCGFAAGADGLLGTADDVPVCSSENVVSVSTKNKKFSNVTQQLTTLVVDIDGVQTRVGIFDSRLQDYFWSMDTTGKAHLQAFFISAGAGK